MPVPPARTTTTLRVLLVGSGLARDPVDATLRGSGFDPVWVLAQDGAALSAVLTGPAAQAPEVVLCPLPTTVGPTLAEAVRRVRGRVPYAPLIVVAEQLGRQDLAAVLHGGVTDVVFTDELHRIGPLVAGSLATQVQARREREARSLHHQSALLLSGLVHHAPAAICVRDRSGSPVAANARYEALVALGLPPPTLTPKTASSVVIEVGSVTLMALTFPVIGVAGLAIAHGEILMDITAQKRTETELLAARAELERQATDLRASNADLVELDRLKTDLVSTVSHELRTPLTSILGYTELLTDELTDRPEGLDNGLLHMIEVISRNSSRLLGLIDNLLVLAKLDGIESASAAASGTDAGGPSGGPVDLGAVLDTVRVTLQPSADAAGLELAVRLPELPVVVTGSGEQLERAVLNLASNAVKFSTSGGLVTLSVRVQGDEVLLEVEDRGIGIAARELPLLGTRFFRSESARVEQVQGSGLGLSVVQGIAALHGGTFEIESELGVGTVARLRLVRQRVTV